MDFIEIMFKIFSWQCTSSETNSTKNHMTSTAVTKRKINKFNKNRIEKLQKLNAYISE